MMTETRREIEATEMVSETAQAEAKQNIRQDWRELQGLSEAMADRGRVRAKIQELIRGIVLEVKNRDTLTAIVHFKNGQTTTIELGRSKGKMKFSLGIAWEEPPEKNTKEKNQSKK